MSVPGMDAIRCDALRCMPHEATDGEGRAVSSERASEREYALGLGSGDCTSMSLKTCAVQSYTSYTSYTIIQYHLVPLHQGLIPLRWE